MHVRGTEVEVFMFQFLLFLMVPHVPYGRAFNADDFIAGKPTDL